MDERRSLRLYAAALIALALIFALAGQSLPGPGTAQEAAACTPALPHASGSTTESITTSDGPREYRLHVPPSYDGSEPVPLVLNFHGATGTSGGHEAFTKFSEKADAEGFIVAYPQGSTLGWASTHFNAFELPPPQPDDVAFAGAILDELEAELCVDGARVYAAGFSNGAFMAVRLACSLSDRVAAIGVVSGPYYPPLDLGLNPGETCAGTDSVPIVAFHGTADLTVPFGGGPGGFLNYRLPIDDPAANDAMESWAVHNGCASGRQEADVTATVTLVSYEDCADGSKVALYVIEGGTHAWPGGNGSQDVSATQTIWEFFEDYELDGAVATDLDGDALADPFDPDDDGDGCDDVREMVTAPGSQALGGLRDPDNAWDFYDTDHNGVADLDDIFNVAYAFGASESGGGFGDPAMYDVRLDRSAPPAGGALWEVGGPDGIIDLSNDIFGVIFQFGHSCQ